MCASACTWVCPWLPAWSLSPWTGACDGSGVAALTSCTRHARANLWHRRQVTCVPEKNVSSLPFFPTLKCVFHLGVTGHVRAEEKREFPTFPPLEVTTSHVRDGEKREFPTCSPTVEMCLSFRSHRSYAWCRET